MELLILHAAATWFMVGLIWVVQLIHYPLFALVGKSSFTEYEAAHTSRMGAALAVPAIVEVVAAALVFATLPAGVSRLTALAGGGFLAAIWLITAAVHVRQHRALAAGFDAVIHRDLVRSNWLRTALWSGRGVLAAVMLG